MPRGKIKESPGDIRNIALGRKRDYARKERKVYIRTDYLYLY